MKKTNLKTYLEFINEEHYEEVEGSAFTDILYHTSSGPTFGTDDQITIDFIHTITPYFENDDDLFRERLHKFNMYHKVAIDYDKLKEALPIIEQEWMGDFDLTLDMIETIVEDPSKIKDLAKSIHSINKYDL